MLYTRVTKLAFKWHLMSFNTGRPPLGGFFVYTKKHEIKY